MAMEMAGQVAMAQPPAVVWAALNDVETLKKSISGCQELERISPTEMKAKVKFGVGPIKTTFTGSVRFLNVDEPNSFTLSGKGQGGIAGFAEGTADVVLQETDAGGTLMTYSVRSIVGGKLAQIGARLIDGIAKRYADDFFVTFTQTLEVEPTAGCRPSPSIADGSDSGRVDGSVQY